MATENTIKILHLEDSPVDAELISELILATGMKAEIELAEDRQQFETALKRGADYDLIITDFMLPRFNSFGALEMVRELCPHVPVICVSGAIGEETAIEVLKAGAVDYVLKRPSRAPSERHQKGYRSFAGEENAPGCRRREPYPFEGTSPEPGSHPGDRKGSQDKVC